MEFMNYYYGEGRRFLMEGIDECDDYFSEKDKECVSKIDNYLKFSATTLSRAIITSTHDDLVKRGYFDKSRTAGSAKLRHVETALNCLYRM